MICRERSKSSKKVAIFVSVGQIAQSINSRVTCHSCVPLTSGLVIVWWRKCVLNECVTVCVCHCSRVWDNTRAAGIEGGGGRCLISCCWLDMKFTIDVVLFRGSKHRCRHRFFKKSTESRGVEVGTSYFLLAFFSITLGLWTKPVPFFSKVAKSFVTLTPLQRHLLQLRHRETHSNAIHHQALLQPHNKILGLWSPPCRSKSICKRY